MCCSPWAHRESDTTEPQQTKLQFFIHRLPKASPGHQEPPGPALPPPPLQLIISTPDGTEAICIWATMTDFYFAAVRKSPRSVTRTLPS